MNRTVLVACALLAAAVTHAETVTVTASRLLDVDSGRILRDQVLTIEDFQ